MDWLGAGRSQNAYEHFWMPQAEYQGKDFPRSMELSRQEPSELGNVPQQLVFCSLGYHTLHTSVPHPHFQLCRCCPACMGAPWPKYIKFSQEVAATSHWVYFCPDLKLKGSM